MSFYSKYELVEVLRDDGVKTFQAREIATGKPVEVHLVVGQPGKSEPPFELLDKVRSLPAENRSRVVETGEHMGTPYVVTLPLDGYASFRDWVAAVSAPAKPRTDSLSRVGRWKIPAVESKPAAPAPSLPPPPTTERVPQPETPDITRMFSTAELVIPSQTVESPQPPAAPPPAPTPASSSEAGMDEFEKLFFSK